MHFSAQEPIGNYNTGSYGGNVLAKQVLAFQAVFLWNELHFLNKEFLNNSKYMETECLRSFVSVTHVLLLIDVPCWVSFSPIAFGLCYQLFLGCQQFSIWYIKKNNYRVFFPSRAVFYCCEMMSYIYSSNRFAKAVGRQSPTKQGEKFPVSLDKDFGM